MLRALDKCARPSATMSLSQRIEPSFDGIAPEPARRAVPVTASSRDPASRALRTSLAAWTGAAVSAVVLACGAMFTDAPTGRNAAIAGQDDVETTGSLTPAGQLASEKAIRPVTFT